MTPLKIAMLSLTHGHTRKYYQTLRDSPKLDWVAACAENDAARRRLQIVHPGRAITGHGWLDRLADRFQVVPPRTGRALMLQSCDRNICWRRTRFMICRPSQFNPLDRANFLP